MDYEHSEPEDYKDRYQNPKAPGVLYLCNEGRGINFFLFKQHPSRTGDYWFATPTFLGNGPEGFSPEETKKLTPITNPKEHAEWLRKSADLIETQTPAKRPTLGEKMLREDEKLRRDKERPRKEE